MFFFLTHVCAKFPVLCLTCWTVVRQKSDGVLMQQWKFISCSACIVRVCCGDKVWSRVLLYASAVESLGSQTGGLLHLENISIVRPAQWRRCSAIHTRLWADSLFARLELHVLFLHRGAKPVDKVLCGGI